MFLILTVSHTFILQQFSMVISHCSPDCCGRYVKGVMFLLTTMRFLMRGRRLSLHTSTESAASDIIADEHIAISAKKKGSFNRLSQIFSSDFKACEVILFSRRLAFSSHLEETITIIIINVGDTIQ